jgi:hypothetical protein
MPKSYRIRTQVGVDKYINVNLEQDWESLEILSLKILANDVYTRFCSDYGVVTGRVYVNNGFGLPNAKVSVFIPLEETDELDPAITDLYPFKSVNDTNEEGYRYNLLPKLPSYDGHASTGTFPNKADMLMDGSYIEVFDKYYRFTVSTNESGDFMIFGVPVGTQTIVMDVDISDIGCFSVLPQDLILQGLATETQVNGARFKSSTNLNELPQIKNLVFDVDVRPFWGDNDLCQVGITRVDFDLSKLANLTIQPSSIFMGSIISTTDDNALKVSCKPKQNTGNLCEMVAGPGEIQAIRQTIFTDTNGLPILERYSIEQGGKVIDGDGTYLLNVPMNMDYVYTNEFGQLSMSNDPKVGVPTKGKYRFKFRWQNEEGLQSSFLRADFLVPNVKEYGWSNSGIDPFQTYGSTPYDYTIAAGLTSGITYTMSFDSGLSMSDVINSESYQIIINGLPYIGSINSIQLNVGDTFQINGVPLDSTQDQIFSFNQYSSQLFDLLQSYSFSTDWDDYVNPEEAINCEDTFYEFNYNKVYTTAMFLDRYKNGIGRAKHLGIKEIDDVSCKSTVNTFPVNDIIRNFDAIFFVFNILINVLTFPILVLLFVAHLIALIWPLLKYLLLFLGPFIIAMGVKSAVDLAYYILSLANLNLGGPVISVATVLQIISQSVYTLLTLAAGITFTIFYTKFFNNSTKNGKIDNFPRIGLPMISYPDCTSCDCDCGTASLDDDFDANSIQKEIQDAQDGLSAQGGGGYDLTVTQPNSLIAPLNSPQSYVITHPNLENNEDENDPFDCGGLNTKFKSFETLIGSNDISSDVVVRAVLDFQRMFSGYDVLSSTDPNKYIPNEAYLLKAPQPFLFGAKKTSPDERYFAFPTEVTLAQKLNEFNTRDKYFYSNTTNVTNSGVNRIKTLVNPDLASTPFEDQVVVVLMESGSASQIGVGNLLTFQDPNSTNTGSISRLINITGATTNQFQNNSITGVTETGITTTTVYYANPSDPTSSLLSNVILNSPQVSQLPVIGNTNVEQSYLQYNPDIEYFQLVTGMTISDFNILKNPTAVSGFFPATYLYHNMTYIRPNCGLNGFITETVADYIQYMSDYQNYEICIFVRGVDPNTVKQTIKYDLSRIFGYNSYNNITIDGQYYMNVPIQALPSGVKPAQHDGPTNNVNNLYFPSYTFTVDSSAYTAFTSNLPYYYLNTDDTLSSSYSPYASYWNTNANNTLSLQQTLINNQSLPLSSNSFYTVGGSYIRWNPTVQIAVEYFTASNSNGCDSDCQRLQYYNYTGSYFVSQAGLTATYSPAYYRYSLSEVNFSDSSKLVMRSDRLPTSTGIQNGADTHTGFALHQNDNFAFYAVGGVLSPPSIFAGGDISTGESNDQDDITSGLTNTLICEGMVPLACYSGSGSNVGVLPSGQCTVPANRMINGCYCLLNKKYVSEYADDVKLFLEWKVRFTMNFAACRGVFAQTFQNNWINGVLYMFNFNKRTTFSIQQDTTYNYCDDVIMFNELTNVFYYRSSPWNSITDEFIGKNPPSTPIFGDLLDFPGLGYNEKQIQFPTTVVDLGPRDSFINEICCSGDDSDFGSYYTDQLKSSSYQDNSSIVQLGFLSRILNQGVRQRILPISAGGSNSEGKGIIQFFNSDRGGYRIDGDWAQMLSINSEWKVLPFITENVPSADYIYFGDNQNGIPNSIDPEKIKPIMGLFFTASTPEIRYRKIMSPGIETYNFNPLIEEKFGYPKSQVVPHYKWFITTPETYTGTPNIFGSEDNNWYTNSSFNGGFFSKKYQDLDFISPNEKYQTSLTQVGYIASFNLTGGTMPITPLANISQGDPSTNYQNSVVVGAPYHFYFGLNNGKTAINRFYKLYVATVEE